MTAAREPNSSSGFVRYQTETLSNLSGLFFRRTYAREGTLARYYFDIHDGQELVRDDVGSECANPEAIQKEATEALGDISQIAILNGGDRQTYAVLVRNERGAAVYMALHTITGLWLGENAKPKPRQSELGETAT